MSVAAGVAPGVARARRLLPAAPDGARIGLLGGSFNPAHAGHLHISREAMRRLRLRAVWWLVSPQNPLKPRAGMAPLPDRLAAARRAARDPRIAVSDVEQRLGLRFTADTIAALRRLRPRLRFVWLMGADNLGQIAAWKGWTRIFAAVPIAVLARAPYAHRALRGAAAQRYAAARRGPRTSVRLACQRPPAWAFLPIRLHPASATALRRANALYHSTTSKERT